MFCLEIIEILCSDSDLYFFVPLLTKKKIIKNDIQF